jgi:Ni/Fe-hydrogenase subunit HybB-like protein
LSVLLALFLVARFGELIWRNKLSFAFAGDGYSLMFWAEIVLLAFPLVVFRVPRLRNDARFLFTGAVSMLLGCALWRCPTRCWHSTPVMATTTSQRLKS